MKERIQTLETETLNNQKIGTGRKMDSTPDDLVRINRISEILASEGNESLKHYIEWLGLSHDPKLVVLSSIHHYYYDAEEMTNVKTVVNLKELNHIKDIRNFLNSMFLILPPKCYLIGCFIDNKRQKVLTYRNRQLQSGYDRMSEDVKNGILSKIPLLGTIFSLLDVRTNKHLSVKKVTQLLSNSGFNTMDMTELRGLTYFCAQSQRTSEN